MIVRGLFPGVCFGRERRECHYTDRRITDEATLQPRLACVRGGMTFFFFFNFRHSDMGTVVDVKITSAIKPIPFFLFLFFFFFCLES